MVPQAHNPVTLAAKSRLILPPEEGVQMPSQAKPSTRPPKPTTKVGELLILNGQIIYLTLLHVSLKKSCASWVPC